MNRAQADILIQKYNQGVLSSEEEGLLEQYIEAGWIELEALEDIQQLSMQLDEALVQPIHESIRTDFYTMLETEKTKEKNSLLKKWRIFLDSLFSPTPGLSIAYSLGLLIIGLGIGLWVNQNGKSNQQEMAQLSSQLKDMQELMMLNMLEKESTSERLKAVNLTQEMGNASERVVDALLQTLNNDQNVNVRLSALEALYQYAGNPKVREGLIQSISQQKSPLVQLGLAEAMVALQEKRSVEALQELLKRSETPPPVKEQLKNSIEILL